MTHAYEEEDSFEDLDSLDSNELKDLIDQIAPTDAECSVDQYISGDNDIPVCFEHENEKWEEQFFARIVPSTPVPPSGAEMEDPEDLELD